MVVKSKDGLHRCPHCGSSDVSLDTKEGKLKCNYCKTLFEAKSENALGGVEGMKGETRGEGAEDIIPGEDIVKTFRCPSCGAEVVINTEESTSASCHWCKHIFSVNEKISNGAVPDLVLPFKITKEEAEKKIKVCLEENETLMDVDFVAQFNAGDIRGVYFPYLIVDVNGHLTMRGQAEMTKNGGSTYLRSVDLYDVTREFDILVDDLTVESSAKRLNQDTCINSNNIINAILPYDTENAVAWDANYLRSFASEKRSVNVDNLKEIVALQTGDIARYRAKHETAAEYDRGIRWDKEHLGIKGTKWKAAYLPVWLYSYKRPKESGDERIYYIAVNGRTGELAACLPDKKLGREVKAKKAKKPGKVIGAVVVSSIVVFILSVLFGLVLLGVLSFIWGLYIMPIWAILYAINSKRQVSKVAESQLGAILVNQNKRHHHETETVAEIKNLEKTDNYVRTIDRGYYGAIAGKNDDRVIGALSTGRSEMLDSERGRFQIGSNYTNAGISAAAASYRRKQNRSSMSEIIWIILFVLFVLMAIMSGGGGSGTGSSGSYSSSDNDWGSSSSWDSGSSWDSSGSSFDSGGGFDYSYDY